MHRGMINQMNTYIIVSMIIKRNSYLERVLLRNIVNLVSIMGPSWLRVLVSFYYEPS